MRQVVCVTIALASAALSTTEARADGFLDGNDLYQECTADKNTTTYYQRNASCSAYVVGVADAISFNRAIMKKDYCLPQNATRGQLKDVVTLWLREHPALRSYGAAGLVTLALTEAFPACGD
jgi:hypothetical protein